MPKKLLSLDDHIQDISTSRDRSGGGRFQLVPAGTELVGEVVLNSCSAVAAAFTDQGFRWAKSGLRFSRKVGPFTHIVSFQSDGANTSGHHIAVAMHAQVKSAALEKWRLANNGVTDGANLWITQVGYLNPTHEYLKWQLVDPQTRADEIQSMIGTVRNHVLPAFDACSSMEKLSARLLERNEIVRFPDWALDIALWAGNEQAAKSLVRIFLESKPDLAGFFYQEYERQRQTPAVGIPANRYQAFVRLCIDHELLIPGMA
ncbi:hypothetical protein [Duganella radicis]|uniref:Uncharacterized protein n=1 Tax=Duganella radicis TaxID=551988 RepID=A0A6L6PG51_9BURK|nr:hypothetical protein [Duganella radicis]MTV37994.1 hypothetical protein [Duganella radicis]